MPTPLALLGSGAHFRELLHIVTRRIAYDAQYELAGRFTASGKADDGVDLEILGNFDSLERFASLACIADNEVDASVVARVPNLASVADPTAFVDPSAEIGGGTVIYPSAFIGARARLGRRCWIMAGSVINHDCRLGDGVIATSQAALAGYVTVGNGTYLGQSSTVRQYLHIGERAMLGMGAVVISDVADGTTVVGNPARVLERVK